MINRDKKQDARSKMTRLRLETRCAEGTPLNARLKTRFARKAEDTPSAGIEYETENGRNGDTETFEDTVCT
jgi:hypothetical protein